MTPVFSYAGRTKPIGHKKISFSIYYREKIKLKRLNKHRTKK